MTLKVFYYSGIVLYIVLLLYSVSIHSYTTTDSWAPDQIKKTQPYTSLLSSSGLTTFFFSVASARPRLFPSLFFFFSLFPSFSFLHLSSFLSLTSNFASPSTSSWYPRVNSFFVCEEKSLFVSFLLRYPLNDTLLLFPFFLERFDSRFFPILYFSLIIPFYNNA